jgi:hypothetical protein
MPLVANRRFLPALLALVSLTGCAADPPDSEVGEATAAAEMANVDLDAEGSFSCDFGLPNDLPLPAVPPLIERDRMYMAARPGLITKQLPIGFDPQTGNIFSGGRYLFDTYENARAYADWVRHGFILDGVEFLDRPIFLAPDCHAWRVVGARAYAPTEAQVVMRTERFAVPAGTWGSLHRVFQDARKEAERRGLAAVWLVANEDEGLAQLVYYGPRVGTPDPNAPDFASFGALAGAPALGDSVAPASWSRTFDRTHWVLTVWFPFVAGDQGEPSLWLNSPPFPAPFCGDGVCEPSRGESGASCAADCPAACGDGVCQAGEDTHACPGDCRL